MVEPPEHLWERDEARPRFEPDFELEKWVRAAIIEESGSLANPDHQHLRLARIGMLWTNAEWQRQGQLIAGTAQLGTPVGPGWSKAKAEMQLREWFGGLPDFLITLDACHFAMCDQATRLAIVEHELYHCAQARDKEGFPRFDKDNWPVWGMRGHDVEEFVGVVRRYGSEAAGVTALVNAANREPEISQARIEKVCGNCLRAA